MRIAFLACLTASLALAEPPRIELKAAFQPDQHRIEATATIPVGKDGHARFDLKDSLSIVSLPKGCNDARPSTAPRAPGWATHDLDLSTASPPPATVTFDYAGEIYDPPRAEGGLRHVAGGHTSGTIGPEGIYLHGGTGWYPVLGDEMALYAIEATVPKGWHLVGQGRRVWENESASATSVRWEDPLPASSLEVVAGPYGVTDDKWNDVQVSTYLFAGEKDLAKTYIEPAKQYLEFYSKLLGPYPYPQLSIVENFFSTGYGMPSYTLLGREVVQMAQRYTGAVGLGHEIVHNWWGNGVFVEGSDGNWCEGLTSYCANYYWVEAHDGADAARAARRRLCERFSILVHPEDDFPIAQFGVKKTETDDEVGYDKACFLFHTIRRRIGDDAFWGALRKMTSDFRGRQAKWSDFAAAFQAASGKDVPQLVDRWIASKGLPTLSGRLRAEAGKTYVDLAMQDALPCIVPVRVGDGGAEVLVEMTGPTASAELPGAAARCVVDPDFHVFRRLGPTELVPCLNRVLSATKRAIVKPTGGTAEEQAAYGKLVERLVENGKWEVVADTGPAPPAGASVLYLGGIGVNKAVEKLALPQGVSLAKDGFEVAGKKGAAPSGALLLSMPRPEDPAQVATVFLGLSADAATKAQRFLFYYGWQSWYTFGADGKAADRGDFPLGRSPLDLEPPR